MEQGYLIDTNVIIDFSENRFPEKEKIFISQIIDNEPVISIINKIELLGFFSVPKEIIEFVQSSEVINLNDEIVDMTISLRARFKLKLPDAIIAATAIVSKLTLVTRNIRDFKQIPELIFKNSYDL